MTPGADIYDTYVEALVKGAYLAATRPVAAEGLDVQLWRDAESSLRSTTLAAGRLAAHLIRLRVSAADEHDDVVPLWAGEVVRATRAIAGRDRDEREIAGLAIRRAIAQGPVGDPGSEPARLLAGWLFPPQGQQAKLAAAGQLARYVASHIDRYRDLLDVAWYAVHGLALVDRLVERQPEVAQVGGRPPQGAESDRSALRIAVRGVAAAGRITTKADLAERAGISRVTLDAWLA